MKAGLDRQSTTIGHCEHLLKSLTLRRDGPEIWKDGSMKTIRECIALITSHPESFPALQGDHIPEESLFSDEEDEQGGGETHSLTSGFIAAIAGSGDLDLNDYPILQVAAPPARKFEQNTGGGNNVSHTHFTHLRLCDGSGDQIVGRLNLNLSHAGKQLKVGDIIRPELFTPITYQVSGADKPQRSPAIVIHTYRQVGYALLPASLNDPLHCTDMTAEELAAAKKNNLNTPSASYYGDDGVQYEDLEEVECTPENRYCAVHTRRCLGGIVDLPAWSRRLNCLPLLSLVRIELWLLEPTTTSGWQRGRRRWTIRPTSNSCFSTGRPAIEVCLPRW